MSCTSGFADDRGTVARLAYVAVCVFLLTSSFVAAAIPEVKIVDLPQEARHTITLIRGGGPYPYQRDGAFFGNFEKHLPVRPRGYYKEYTVPTPGLRSRGAKRIVMGASGEMYYTDDHYHTFRRIRE